ncbi:hypothetical protein K474DRAFT_923230 [Panus rudis PR-1116 ss-1]|nr:hypothetical protein K474DRAFT_923230 [Panus rudis PR-1116 ss-1]
MTSFNHRNCCWIFIAVVSVIICFLSIPLHAWKSLYASSINLNHARLTFNVPPRQHVTMHIIPTSSHYDLGSQSWSKMLPTSGHLVHTSDPDGSVSVKTVALFHQLKCLDILHQAYVDEGSHRTSTLVEHCMNYLRQTFLCQMDMRNEPQGSTFTNNGFDTLCYDWEKIFSEAERNHVVRNTR